MKSKLPFIPKYLTLLMFVTSAPGFAQESYSPYVDQSYPSSVYWGDTHLHTNLSFDANMLGNKNLGPDEAYRLALGEMMEAHNGMKVRLGRPLDFLVVADHAESMGVMAGLETLDPALLETERGQELYQMLLKTRKKSEHKQLLPPEFAANLFEKGSIQGYRKPVWDRVIAAAEKYNKPGIFTAFIGYEWSPSPPEADAGGVHRVVIFKDGMNTVNKVVPFSSEDGNDPEDLWKYLAGYERQTGGEVLAIPHNGNLTAGAMFALTDSKGNPLSSEYAEARSRWEPLVEVTQIKGDGETHPLLSPTDEFADYYTFTNTVFHPNSKRTEDWRRQYEYARSALKFGLQEQARLGVNPFKFGMIGSTDSHTSIPSAEENNFWGKMTDREPSAHRMEISAKWRYAAAGYVAVWATENTREALFAAMKRKEVYATTGPRMTVRFFGGWGYEKGDAMRPDIVKTGYTKGVPMGGDLANAPKDKSPSFLIHVAKDPDGANLDRVQVVKGWRSKDGELHEKVYNVALSDGRVEDESGKAPPVGNTVDVADASYTNTIGDPELAVVWVDPDFNPDELAFYYVRVLEIPTPRWTAYDVKYFALKDIPEEVHMITQERAYTSPIWFTPEGNNR